MCDRSHLKARDDHEVTALFREFIELHKRPPRSSHELMRWYSAFMGLGSNRGKIEAWCKEHGLRVDGDGTVYDKRGDVFLLGRA